MHHLPSQFSGLFRGFIRAGHRYVQMPMGRHTRRAFVRTDRECPGRYATVEFE
jgi:hypothetical protein